MTRVGLAGLAAAIGAVGTLWLVDREADPAAQVETPVRLSDTRPAELAPLAAPTPLGDRGGTLLSHREPPPASALANDPARQAAYDAEAKPGEFVTPPNISIEH